MIKILIAAALLMCGSDAYKILVIFPIAGKSHSILGDGIVRHLLNAGHEVSLITPYPHESRTNLTTVLTIKSEGFTENTLNLKALMDKELDMKSYEVLQTMMLKIAKDTFNDESVQNLFKDRTKTFDLVIAEWMICDLYSAVAAVYNCPFIWMNPVEPHWLVTRTVDEYLNPAYNTEVLSDAVPPFTFVERVHELWYQITGTLRMMRFFKLEKKIYDSSIVPIIKERGLTVPPYEDVIWKTSLVLGNGHVSTGLAPRLPQNYKCIGGYHIDTDLTPLSQELQKILDSAKHGVIYFSMGSNLKSKDIPDNLKKGFLEIFSGLKQTVIWKFEEVLPDLPKNVHILQWAPQTSILAHPNCILFITHGGLLSITEALHFAKPIIGIPVFADQFGNVNIATKKGFGRKVELSYTMDVDLKIQLDEILRDPSYTQKAKEWSFIYHDRPTTSGQDVVFWSEHVIKTKGAEHLRSAAFLMPWYQKLYLDLLALVFVFIILVIYILRKLLKVILEKQVINKKNKEL